MIKEYNQHELEEIYYNADKIQYRSDIYNFLIKETAFLSTAFPKQRLWHILNNTKDIPTCKTCNKPVKWDDAKPFRQQQYRAFCSTKCSNHHSDTRNKKSETEKNLYGDKKQLVVEKMKNTNLAKYGVEFIGKSQLHRNQSNQTIIDRYGSFSNMYDHIISKRNNTNIQRYGTDKPQQLDHIKNKTINTTVLKYGSVSTRYKKSQEKYKQTCFDKYGKHSSQRHIAQQVLFDLKNPDILIKLHHDQSLSITVIAKIFNVHHSSIKRYMDQHNIEIRHFKNISTKCLDWLNITAKENNIMIQHLHNGGEFRIPNTYYSADGYCEETNTIYEFHGDYWHGNPLVYNPDDINPHTNCTFSELYNKTTIKENKIKNLGYNLVVIWENEYNLLFNKGKNT